MKYNLLASSDESLPISHASSDDLDEDTRPGYAQLALVGIGLLMLGVVVGRGLQGVQALSSGLSYGAAGGVFGFGLANSLIHVDECVLAP